MDKLSHNSADLVQQNIDKITQLFPHVVTETQVDGELRFGIDFEALKQELSETFIEPTSERYGLSWPGKRQAQFIANQPIAKTLRPNREESVDFDTTENLFIEGDNLEALKLLQNSYTGKIKLIYIDPPYNRGSDLIYKDNYSQSPQEYLYSSDQIDNLGNKYFSNLETNGRFHSDWLSMMYSRIILSKKLLCESGFIIIHIDEHEYENLEKICDEIYNEKNKLGTVVWDKKNPKGDSKKISYQHEYILIYAKNMSEFMKSTNFHTKKKNVVTMNSVASKFFNKINSNYSLEDANKEYAKWVKFNENLSGGEKGYTKIDQQGRVFQPVSMAWPNRNVAPDDYWIPIVHPETGKECPVPAKGWRYPSQTIKRMILENKIIFGKDHKVQPRNKYLLNDNEFESISSIIRNGFSDSSRLAKYETPFDDPKPISLISDLIEFTVESDEFIIDFFAGSSSTAEAVIQQNLRDSKNRKFIMIQLPEKIASNSAAYEKGFKNIADLSRERIRQVGKHVQDQTRTSGNQSDLGFRALTVASSNFADVYMEPDELGQADLFSQQDSLRENRTGEDYLFEILLQLGEELSVPVERLTNFGVEDIYSADHNAIIGCFTAEITEDLVRSIAAYANEEMTQTVVFLDSALTNDALLENVHQIFKQLAPEASVKVI